MTKDEAMKQALEAMERYQVKRQDFDRFADEITAIKQALAAPVQEPVAWVQRATEWLLDLPKTPLDYPYFTNGMFKNDCHSLAEALQGYTPPAAHAAWKWHQAPSKTSWGHEMVVADLAIDKDNTVSVYCERDQTTKVEAMFTPPAAQRQWVTFPTMLRKMWSGSEVQAWLDETVNKENT
jgi:hypothetical protein